MYFQQDEQEEEKKLNNRAREIVEVIKSDKNNKESHQN
jgi:hypothetical protein